MLAVGPLSAAGARRFPAGRGPIVPRCRVRGKTDVEREFVPLLRTSRVWRGPLLTVLVRAAENGINSVLRRADAALAGL